MITLVIVLKTYNQNYSTLMIAPIMQNFVLAIKNTLVGKSLNTVWDLHIGRRFLSKAIRPQMALLLKTRLFMILIILPVLQAFNK
jgi:hypothetical protein